MVRKGESGTRWAGALALGAAAVLLASCDTATTEVPLADYELRSRDLAARFQSVLREELKSALETVGPVGALGVCQQVAPAIAQQLSAESGAEVRRIAVRNRNPDAEATGEFAQKLAGLEAAPLTAEGTPATVLWTESRNGERQVHFLSAITMKEQPCAACHGTNISPQVKAKLDELYPQDKAIGFTPGELRGAIAISWPVL